jgi:hypothetical protein
MKLTISMIKNLVREVLAEGSLPQYETGKDIALTIADAITYGDEIEEEDEDLRAAQAFAREHARDSIEGHPELTYQDVVDRISPLLQDGNDELT